MFANNADYQLAYTAKTLQGDVRFYIPTNPATGYHHSRYVEAVHNDIYARSGATKETIRTITEEMVHICNRELNSLTMRTDLALLANNLLYRTQHPIDQHCAIRQGVILTFMETDTAFEDPKTISGNWMQRKEAMAHQDPDLYSFFLTLGYSNLESYSEPLSTLLDEDYFLKRTQVLQTMWPPQRNAGVSSEVSKP